ncbi:MAG: hypothetical protein ACJAUH_003008, partial [Saprospiraceae bacterium]
NGDFIRFNFLEYFSELESNCLLILLAFLPFFLPIYTAGGRRNI